MRRHTTVPLASAVTHCTHPRKHRAKGTHDSPKYGLLFAASAGCLECVKDWVEDKGQSVQQASDNHFDWDVLSYAQHGLETPEKFRVIEYVRERLKLELAPVTSAAVAATAVIATTTGVPDPERPLLNQSAPSKAPPVCPGLATHGANQDMLDICINAAGDGCLQCVKYLVQDKDIDPTVAGLGVWGITPLQAAKRGRLSGRPGCGAVLKYLRQYVALQADI